jgi:hypothetical protein
MLRSFVVLAIGLWSAAWPGTSLAEFIEQTIANNTGQDANALHLVFAQSTFPNALALKPKSEVTITPLGPGTKAATVKANRDNGAWYTADFGAGSFGTIESGNTANEKANIKFERPGDRNTHISVSSF